MSTTAATNNFNQLYDRIVLTTNSSTNSSTILSSSVINIEDDTGSNVKDQMNSLLSIKPELLLNGTGLLTIYCFIKNFIGATGTSTVAIDNKIEQAMDLVKSHLMFAVREEVEVLKERIAELMDRINQLEVENNILKANATQETLIQLTTITPSTKSSQQNSTNPTNGPVS